MPPTVPPSPSSDPRLPIPAGAPAPGPTRPGPLSRRRFLTLGAGAVGAGAAARWTVVGGGAVAGAEAGFAPARTGTGGDPVLVVVVANGGNDALNTLVPTGGRYHDLRPTLAIDDAELVTVAGRTDVGLHPALAPLAAGPLGASVAWVPHVGFDAQGRSHFQAMDGWAAGEAGAPPTTGWLGRWLDATGTDDDHPLRAVALGGGARLLAAERSIATVVRSPDRFELLGVPGIDAPALAGSLVGASVGGDGLAGAASAAFPAALAAVDALAGLAGDRPAGDGARGRRGVADLLELAAGLVASEPATRVVVVNTGGFDTHSAQAAAHAGLLAGLADGIGRFHAAVTASGDADRTMLLVTSEFGRRAAENGSGGTDHGGAGTLLALGPSIPGGVHGEVDVDDLADGDLRSHVDPRALFAAALDHLGGADPADLLTATPAPPW